MVAEGGHLRRSRRIARQELVSRDQGAQLEGPPAERAPPFEVRELEAATADVDEVAGVDGQAVDRSEKGESRLLLAVDNLDGEAGVGFQPGEDAVAVDRGADRRGGNGDGPLGPCGSGDSAEVAHRRDRLRDGCGLEPAARVDMAGKLEGGSGVGDDVKLARVHRAAARRFGPSSTLCR